MPTEQLLIRLPDDARASRRCGDLHRLVRRGRPPVLPAAADALAAFIDAMAAGKGPATVRRYVSSVATFHRAAKVANPCVAEAVKLLALKRMHRERGRAQQQAAARNWWGCSARGALLVLQEKTIKPLLA